MFLLERDDDLNTLDRALSEVSEGRGKMVLVTGEAGAGKTSLVRAFARRAENRADVYLGVCDPLDAPQPLGPLLDFASDLSPELADLLAASEERYRVRQAFLASLAGSRLPKLVVLEDVHWADEATLDLLRYVGRRVETVPALIVVTFRDDEVGREHPLRTVLGDIATSRGVTRQRLAPLSEQAVSELAAGSSLDPAALHRRTGGNPFFVTEILAAEGEEIPETVRDAVLARAARLSRSARAVLDAAAVIGPTVPAWLLAGVTQAESETVDECLASGVLTTHLAGCAFRHELGREAILDVLPSYRRVDLDREVLEVLERSGHAGDTEVLARLAHHAEGALDAGSVLRYAPEAARRASQLGAHREAAKQYARALQWGESIDSATHAELLRAYADECQITDQMDTALEALREAIQIERKRGDHRKLGATLSQYAKWMVVSGYKHEGEQASKEAISLLETLPVGPELALAYAMESSIRMLDRDNADAIAAGMKAIDLAGQFDATRVMIFACNSTGAARIMSGDGDGVALLERSIDLARQSGDDAYVANGYLNIGSGLGEMHAFEEARGWLEAGIAFSAERDLDYARGYMESWLSLVHLHQGKWELAASTAVDLVSRENLAIISRIMSRLALGRVRSRRGDPDAWAVLDEALTLSIQTDSLQRLAPVRAARAEAAWLSGDLSRTAAEAAVVYDAAVAQRHPWFTGEAAYWQWKAGGKVDVLEFVAEPYAWQIRGEWRRAADAWRELGCPYEAARALSESGDEAALREALDTFRSLGARPMQAVVQRRLRDLGVRSVPRGPRPATKANPAGLTRREAEVLDLVRAGLNNSEIADRLYLSPRTIEHHVSAILAKLNVRSRIEAARAVPDVSAASPN